MSQSLSIRFQPPEQLTGPTRDVFMLLRNPIGYEPGSQHDAIEPPTLPVSLAQDQLNERLLRQKLRTLERERALKTVDGTAIWIITDSMSLNPALGERMDDRIVGAGLGKGRIFYGPHNFCLPSGVYMAIIEFHVTNMVDKRRARVAGEVILNNQKYLSQQTKSISAKGSYTFRLPFRVRENDLLEQIRPAIEVRLNLKTVVGVVITQVAVLAKPSSMRSFAAHPAAHLHSTANAWLKRVGRIIMKPRA